MRPIMMICFALVLNLVVDSVSAGEIRELELNDGSVITGEVLSLSSGIYTIRSNSLGDIRIEESKIRTIRMKSSSANGGVSVGQVKPLQEKMMSDREIMSLIQSLQNDPEFKRILEDPETMKAVNAGDIAALMANPKFMKLLNHSTVQEIEKKVK